MITGVLLCAGRGTRFGSHAGSQKLLAPLPSGEPIVQAAAIRLLAAADHVVAVVEEYQRDNQLITLLDKLGCSIAYNPRATEGMGTSIAVGIAAAADANGWLIALGDMPFVQPRSMMAIIEALESLRGIVVPTYQGQRGHPVGFDSQFQAELLALANDIGGRDIVQAHPDMLTLLALDDAGIIQDIDRPEDLESYA